MLTAELTTTMVLVLDAGKDMTMLMEDAFSLPQTQWHPLCKDARSGTGMLKLAQNALPSGISMLTMSVLKFLPFVLLMMLMELVLVVTVDSISIMESVKLLLVNLFPMKDATLGKLVSALPALKTGSSIQTMSVELSQINVELMILLMDGAQLAMQDMI